MHKVWGLFITGDNKLIALEFPSITECKNHADENTDLYLAKMIVGKEIALELAGKTYGGK